MPRVDPVVVRELRLYLESEPKLFGEKKDVLRLLLSRKGGPADRLWLAWVRQGAAMFSREMGIDVPKEALLLLAKQISAQEETKLLRGDYDGIKLAYVENPVKKTATVNEALSHLALVKVAEASSALEGTSKKGSEVARQDLNRIVKKVASLAESPNFDSLEIQASLFDLVGKAETVYSHFSGETKVASETRVAAKAPSLNSLSALLKSRAEDARKHESKQSELRQQILDAVSGIETFAKEALKSFDKELQAKALDLVSNALEVMEEQGAGLFRSTRIAFPAARKRLEDAERHLQNSLK